MSACSWIDKCRIRRDERKILAMEILSRLIANSLRNPEEEKSHE